MGLGKLALAQNRLTQARSHFNEAIKFEQADIAAEAQFDLGQSYVQEQNERQAIAEWLKLKPFYDDSPEWAAKGIIAAAQAHERLREFDEASRLYREVITRYPASRKSVQTSQQRLAVLRER